MLFAIAMCANGCLFRNKVLTIASTHAPQGAREDAKTPGEKIKRNNTQYRSTLCDANARCRCLEAIAGWTTMAFLAGRGLGHLDVLGFFAFLALLDREFDLVAFIQRAEGVTFNLNCRKVHKDVLIAALGDYESVTFSSVKPFDSTIDHSKYHVCFVCFVNSHDFNRVC
jgi:hypothetical protein